MINENQLPYINVEELVQVESWVGLQLAAETKGAE